jgi:hypothetical protein
MVWSDSGIDMCVFSFSLCYLQIDKRGKKIFKTHYKGLKTMIAIGLICAVVGITGILFFAWEICSSSKVEKFEELHLQQFLARHICELSREMLRAQKQIYPCLTCYKSSEIEIEKYIGMNLKKYTAEDTIAHIEACVNQNMIIEKIIPCQGIKCSALNLWINHLKFKHGGESKAEAIEKSKFFMEEKNNSSQQKTDFFKNN